MRQLRIKIAIFVLAMSFVSAVKPLWLRITGHRAGRYSNNEISWGSEYIWTVKRVKGRHELVVKDQFGSTFSFWVHDTKYFSRGDTLNHK